MEIENLENNPLLSNTFSNTFKICMYQHILTCKDVTSIISMKYLDVKFKSINEAPTFYIKANVVSEKGYKINREYAIKLTESYIREYKLREIMS